LVNQSIWLILIQKNKIVVIGSNSFSGASFVRYLLERGHKVIGVSRSQEPNDVFLPYKWLKEEQNRFRFSQVDLNHDLDKLIKMLTQEEPNYIVNFSALGMVSQSWQKPQDWYQTNVVAQVKLHDQLRKFDFIKKYVHITTPEVYGNTDGWIAETFNFNPSTPYAVSRAACDLHLKSFFEAYDFPVIFTRSANVFGQGQQLYRIIPRSILYSKLNKRFQLHGGGYSERSFVHIEDVSSATYEIIKNGKIGESYHISTNELISIRNLVKKICTFMNKDFKLLVSDSDERLGKDQSYMLDSKKIRNELDWSEKLTLDDGIIQTIEWVSSNLDELQTLPHHYIHKA